MKADRELLRFEAPWPLPDILFAIIKSGEKGRWSLLFRLHAGEATDGAYYYDLTWWLQVRAWWPPIFSSHGWVRRDMCN